MIRLINCEISAWKANVSKLSGSDVDIFSELVSDG